MSEITSTNVSSTAVGSFIVALEPSNEDSNKKHQSPQQKVKQDDGREIYFTPGEAIQYLLEEHNFRISLATLWRMRDKAEGPRYIKHGRHKNSRVLYPKHELLAWLRSGTVQTMSENV